MEDSVIKSAPINAAITTTAAVTHKMGPVKLLKRSARRCLFGRPDPHNVDQWLTEELNKIQHQQQQRWGFLFGPENLCASAITTEWELLPVPAESVSYIFQLTFFVRIFSVILSISKLMLTIFNIEFSTIHLKMPLICVEISFKNEHSAKDVTLPVLLIFHYRFLSSIAVPFICPLNAHHLNLKIACLAAVI